jgi:uncharacterized protein YkwD
MKQTIVLLAVFLFSAMHKPIINHSKSRVDEDLSISMLASVNALRKAGCTCSGRKMKPVSPLKWNPLLKNAAQGHANDMFEQKYFNHQSRDGRSFDERVTQAGYNWMAVGENIAFGQKTLESVMAAWKKSGGHCQQMMDKNVTEMGAARTGNYWVQDFGKPMRR